MRKFLIVTTILILVFLSACSSTSANSNAAATTASAATTVPAGNNTNVSTGSLSTTYTDAASVEQQLLLGSLQLEGSENAISTDQAKQLLSLWSSLQTFGPGKGNGGQQQPGNDNTGSTPQAPAAQPTSSVDTDSVLTQIEAVLTPGQIQAIASMKLTTSSVQTYISDNNLSMQPRNGGQQGGGQNGTNPPSDGNGSQPQGTPPADGGNGQQPQGTQPSGTMQAPGNGQQLDMTTNVLLNAVIQLLQQKTGTSAN